MSHSHSSPKGHAGKAVMEVINKYYEQTPGFQDVFDEETFYIFAAVFTVATCLAAFVASKYIKLKCKDWDLFVILQQQQQKLCILPLPSLWWKIMIISYENMLQLKCFKILFKQQNLQPFTDFLSEKLTKSKIFFFEFSSKRL